MSKYLLTCVLVFFCGVIGFAQELFPSSGEVFRDDVVPIVRITIDADSLQALYANPESDHEYPAVFQFDNGYVNEWVENVGFRVRGNTSRSSAKKSFKVAFNSFDKEQKFYGLEKMNINGEHNDPSIIRSKLAWDICRFLNIPASRANHVKLYINEEYWGLYINVEHVDEEFVDLRFGSKKGNLYKCLWPADLTYRGADPEEYKFQNGDRRTYQLKTNELEDDYSDIAEFIDVLNNTPMDQLVTELPRVFNVERFLLSMVMDIFTGNWDGPLFNKNNFYLYNNPETELFEYIPYDLDNTFGIDWFNIDWANRDPYNWSASWNDLPLYERVMAVPEYRDQFTELFRTFLEEYVQSDILESRILSAKTLIEPMVLDDPFYPQDYGWDIDDFRNSYFSTLSTNHVKSGLLSYVSNRTNSALVQLDVLGVWDYSIHNDYKVYPNPVIDVVYLQSEDVERVDLYAVDGRLLGSWEIGRDSKEIPLASFRAGTYILTQKLADGKSISQRIVIQ